jgi:DHA2 family multidrug resistance protein
VQLVLSRGQRLDWYDSPEVVIETIGAALAFYLFVTHSLTARQPFLDLGLLLDRNYALGLLLVGVYGMLNFTPVVLLPPLLQEHAGYPDMLIGEVVGARGIGATLGFFSAMFLARLDPRIGMAIGFGLQVVAGLWLMSFDLNTPMTLLALNSVLQGVSVGVIWVPLTIATFGSLEGRRLPEAMAVFHLMRNIGSSFFIALCVTEIVRTQAQNYERLGEAISPYNATLHLPWVMGSWSTDTLADLSRLAKEINRQAAMIGYLNAFTLYTATSALAVLLVLLVPRVRRKA